MILYDWRCQLAINSFICMIESYKATQFRVDSSDNYRTIYKFKYRLYFLQNNKIFIFYFT